MNASVSVEGGAQHGRAGVENFTKIGVSQRI